MSGALALRLGRYRYRLAAIYWPLLFLPGLVRELRRS
jgi:hypothetical protein